MTKPTIYIDGEAGTTGLEIRKRLETRTDIEILSIADDKRKDPAARKKLLNAASLSILCLPDDAAREAASLIENPEAKLLDASTAHRTAPGWVYGFPELTSTQTADIRAAKRVSNPGCYPTGAVALIRPLVDANIIPAEYGLTVNAISGYSGGGKELIQICQTPGASERASAYCLYGLDQKHKHIPEMRQHSALTEDPIFLPSYSSAFYRGMLITIALRLKDLTRSGGKSATAQQIHQTLAARYHGQKYVQVAPLQTSLEKTYVLTPNATTDTNNLILQTFANEEKQTLILTAVLDNLGKGASGAAVQNAEIMLGLKSQN